MQGYADKHAAAQPQRQTKEAREAELLRAWPHGLPVSCCSLGLLLLLELARTAAEIGRRRCCVPGCSGRRGWWPNANSGLNAELAWPLPVCGLVTSE